MNNPLLNQCTLFSLPRVENRAGSITAVNELVDIPFRIARVYYLYDVPGGASRGGHAHKELHQIMVAASGSFDVLLDDGCERRITSLNRPYVGLRIVPGVWRELVNFSSGGICLVLASMRYDPDEYIRGYENYLEFRRAK
jgi:hypothetical protein